MSSTVENAVSQRETTEVACPSAAELEIELARVGAAPSVRPAITLVGQQMHVVLHGRDGSAMGSRLVEAPTGCRERATVAAVLVASWIGIWPEGRARDVPGREPRPAISAVEPPAAGATRGGMQIGVATLGAHDGNAGALGVALEARQRMVGPLHGFLRLAYIAERDRAVGKGMAGYLRPALEVGPTVGLGDNRLQGEIGASARIGILLVRGKGEALSAKYAHTHVAPGVSAHVRALANVAHLSLFVIVSGTWWAGQTRLLLEDDSATSEVPTWDAHLGLGFLWSL